MKGGGIMAAAKNTELQVKKTGEIAHQAEHTRDLPIFIPNTDIYEKEDAFLVLCDLPGVQNDDVDIELESDVLSIKAIRKFTPIDAFKEAYDGSLDCIFERSFELGAEIARDKIKASMKNGVLQILLPKAPEAQAKKIKVVSD